MDGRLQDSRLFVLTGLYLTQAPLMPMHFSRQRQGGLRAATTAVWRCKLGRPLKVHMLPLPGLLTFAASHDGISPDSQPQPPACCEQLARQVYELKVAIRGLENRIDTYLSPSTDVQLGRTMDNRGPHSNAAVLDAGSTEVGAHAKPPADMSVHDRNKSVQGQKLPPSTDGRGSVWSNPSVIFCFWCLVFISVFTIVCGFGAHYVIMSSFALLLSIWGALRQKHT